MVSNRGLPLSILMSYCCPSKAKFVLGTSANAFDVLTSFPNAMVY